MVDQPVQKTISAREFHVVDADGRTRALLACSGDGTPFLQLYDAQRVPRLVAQLDKDDTPHIGLVDENGQFMISIGLRGEDAAITIFSPQGPGVVELENGTGHGNVRVNDASGRVRWDSTGGK